MIKNMISIIFLILQKINDTKIDIKNIIKINNLKIPDNYSFII